MSRALTCSIGLLLLLHLSGVSASAATSLIDLEPGARWELASSWRGRFADRRFTSLIDSVEGSERLFLWHGIYQLTFHPNRAIDLALTAVRRGASGRIDAVYVEAPSLNRVISFDEAEWSSVELSVGRRWTASSNGALWRAAIDVSLCDLPAPCIPAVTGGQISFARASDPLVWRAALSLGRSAVSLFGGVDVVISPALAIGTNMGISKLPFGGGVATWWEQRLTIHLGRERYASVGFGIDLLRHEPNLVLGIDWPLGSD